MEMNLNEYKEAFWSELDNMNYDDINFGLTMDDLYDEWLQNERDRKINTILNGK